MVLRLTSSLTLIESESVWSTNHVSPIFFFIFFSFSQQRNPQRIQSDGNNAKSFIWPQFRLMLSQLRRTLRCMDQRTFVIVNSLAHLYDAYQISKIKHLHITYQLVAFHQLLTFVMGDAHANFSNFSNQ